MQITEADKLERDLEELIRARRMLDEIRKGLSIAKRSTTLWIYLRTSRLIMEIDRRIGMKRGEIAQEEARNGKRPARREKNADGPDPVDADLHGRAEADVLDERQRADAAGRDAGQLGDVESVRNMAAGKGAGGRTDALAGGTAEECLRRRYQERQGLRDWQREAMEAESEGRREALEL